MTIGKKISLYSGISVALVLATSVNSLMRIRLLDRTVHELADSTVPAVYSIGRLSGMAKDIRGNIRGHITADKAEDKVKAERDLERLVPDVEAEAAAYRKTILSAGQREQFESVPAGFAKLVDSAVPIQPLSRQFKTEEAMQLFRTRTMPAFLEVQRAIDTAVAAEKQRANRNRQRAADASESGTGWTLTFLVLAATCCGGLGLYIVQSISQVLHRSVKGLELTSSQTSEAAGHFCASGRSLADGAAQQAASIEITYASTDELRSLAHKTEHDSHQAAGNMRNAAEDVEKASRLLAQLLSLMENGGAANGKISKVFKTIDQIAFQTSVLTLKIAEQTTRSGNRAEEFEAVAGEARDLAQRSAQALVDAAGVLEESAVGAAESKLRLDRVADSVNSVMRSVSSMKSIVDEMQSDSRQQAEGIDFLADAIGSIKKVTQKTAASAAETAVAGEQLNAQSKAMGVVVCQLSALTGNSESPR